MNKDKAIDIAIQCFEERVLANASDVVEWSGTFFLSLFREGIHKWANEKLSTPPLSLVVSGDDLNVDRLDKALRDAFIKRPEICVDFKNVLPIFPFKATFTQKDATALIEMLKKGES